MTSLYEVLELEEERAEQILQELRPADDIVIKASMVRRIIEVAEGKPTNEILLLGAILAMTMQEL